MELSELFEKTCLELERRHIRFAVAGGFAAVLYRDQQRYTKDVDFALFAGAEQRSLLEEILLSLGLDSVHVTRKADLEGGPLFAVKSRSSEPCILIGRKSSVPDGPGIDFMLLAIPWIEAALPRAESNLVDFGFGRVPTLTLEDVILAKLYARRGSNRAKDDDDLQSIFAAEHELDYNYLSGQMHKLRVVVPKNIREAAPLLLQKLSKDVEKRLRKSKKPS